MRGNLLFLGLACLLVATPVAAGTVYRCDSADGGRSYVSKRIPGAKCSAISSYTTSKSPPPARKAATPASATAIGSATPASTTAGSPASVETAGASMTNAAPVKSVKPGSAGSRLVQGQVYSYIKDGVRHYTSDRPKGVVARASAVRTIKYSFLETCFACAAKPGVDFGNVRLNTVAYRDEIAAAAREHGVDEAIVRAVIHAESAFNPNALSRVGAQGLMQLMPATARRFGVGNAFDAGQNIQGGVEYLAWLLKRFDGNLTLAAAGYNAGEGNVDKYNGVPPFSETQRYVQRVGVLAERYRAAQ
ncbi:transglycosylase [Lysobacter arseniciresistens ZS79]|uniref:Transglycosylase n=1 Tax=Lysobacter arseniciresistens ZS79 TaxID=913325 RepID=A0A0A0F267_9GAMM|nr:lytic transglycosylase domain-containing protein [Lysobacter arseniciresistens]KGM56869.1 transglycosylase [Lysobacter arseniciresistens ZS79]